jgi:hypothetical protein
MSRQRLGTIEAPEKSLSLLKSMVPAGGIEPTAWVEQA